MTGAGAQVPLLVTQNYGRGRTAVFATGGELALADAAAARRHDARDVLAAVAALAGERHAPRVVASTPKPVLTDEGDVSCGPRSATPRICRTSDARWKRTSWGRTGSQTVEMRPDPLEQGVYTADWSAEKPGSYVTEIVAKRGQEELGRDAIDVPARRRRGREFPSRAESRTAGETGFADRRPLLPARRKRKQLGQDISYSEAGITVRETRDLWDMPVVFLLALLLRCVGMAAAAEVGCGMRALVRWLLLLGSMARMRRRRLLRDGRGPGRRAGIRAALLRWARTSTRC